MGFALLEVCMYSRCSALICVLTSTLVGGGAALAQATSPAEPLVAHRDWTGHASQSVTRDGSVLNEYIAQTTSVNMDGAVLLVSMIPRFACVAVPSISISEPTIVSRAVDVELLIDVDEQTAIYPFIVDVDSLDVMYTFGVDASDKQKLRFVLDAGDWASFKWSVGSDKPELSDKESSDVPLLASGHIDFSLLGSQRTLEAMEDMCRLHTPIPLKTD